MKQPHTFYRIINIIVLPISAFIGLQVLLFLFIALASPGLLLPTFIMGCVPIYAFTANYFYNKSIRKGEQCKASLKDWIKVNAIVSLIFAALALMVAFAFMAMLNDAKLLNQFWNNIPPNASAEITQQQFREKGKEYCYVMLPFSILLVIHIIISFRLISRYRFRFGELPNDPQ